MAPQDRPAFAQLPADGNGNKVVVPGRATATGVIGRVVINITTGEVLSVAGKAFGDIDELACAALT